MNISRQLWLLLWLAATAAAQMPKACAVIEARTATKDMLERDPDTARIQKALDLCPPGKAVVLKRGVRSGDFVSGPLILPRGVTLWVGGTLLYASPNPRDYDLPPNRCDGTVPAAGEPARCKPFIYSYQGAFSGIGGEGIIDGQGVARELVSSYESQGFHVDSVTLRNAGDVDLAIYKTTGLRVNGVRIDSGEKATTSTGMLLSNAVDARISDARILAPGVALALKASILGGTSGVTVEHLTIRADTGIAIGDDVYGSVRNVSFDRVEIGAKQGIVFNTKGTQGGQAQQIHFLRGCMYNVAVPVRGMPEGRNIDFAHGVWNDRGECGTQPDSIPVDKMEPGLPIVPELETAPRVPYPTGGLTVGPGGFATVQAAIDALPDAGGEVTVQPGTYREVVTIRKPHVHLHGEGDPAAVTIVFNHGPSYGGTFASASVFVEADDTTIDHLTIANDLGAGHGQGVALAVTADRAIFRNVRLLGAQDTLFAASRYCYGDYGPCVAARQYFGDSYIEGNTDFIFGDSLAVFERCELHGIPTGSVMYTAQSRHTAAQTDSGYVFDRCRLTGEARNGSISLGRPWRPYATVVFLDARIDAPAIPAGWTEWARFGKLSLPTAYYAEYHSTGPGADPKAREPYSHQLTAAEAARWRAGRFLAGKDGWNPAK